MSFCPRSVAKLNGCVAAHSVLETVLSQSLLEMGDDVASAKVIGSTTTVHHHHVRFRHIAPETSVYWRTEFLSSWSQADPRPEPSSKCHHSYAVCTFSLCCQRGTKLIPGRNQGSDCSRSYAKRKFLRCCHLGTKLNQGRNQGSKYSHSYAKRKCWIMLSSWNQADPRPEPSSKCHHSYAV